MDHPDKSEHEDSSHQRLEVGTHLEETKEAKPPEINVRPGGDGGDQIWSKSDLGVVAEEDSAFGLEDVSAGAPGTKTDEENKGSGEQDHDQPALKAAARMPQVQDDTNLHRIYNAFKGLDLSELERVFQCTQFPDLFVWKELGGLVNVEAKAEPCGPEDQEHDQPALKAAARMPQVQDDTNLHRIYNAFKGLDLSELERVFQCTQFPDLFVWKELGGLVNVEAKAEPCGPEDQESE
ncbi:hypothetical protein STEG23_032151 [Scotinomys teguina]